MQRLLEVQTNPARSGSSKLTPDVTGEGKCHVVMQLKKSHASPHPLQLLSVS
jgi:hypothetical protein